MNLIPRYNTKQDLTSDDTPKPVIISTAPD